MTADDRPAFDEAAETMKNVIAGIRQWADDDVIVATDRLERAIVDFRKMVPVSTTAPTPAPSWSPVVGGWAEHPTIGRVLVTGAAGVQTSYVVPGTGEFRVAYTDCLSAPRPRTWDRAEDVPAHVVVRDSAGVEWAGADLIADDAVGIGHPLAPFTEVVGGVW